MVMVIPLIIKQLDHTSIALHRVRQLWLTKQRQNKTLKQIIPVSQVSSVWKRRLRLGKYYTWGKHAERHFCQ